MTLYVTFRPPYDELQMPDPVLVLSDYQLDEIGDARWRELQAEAAESSGCEAHELRTLGVSIDGQDAVDLFSSQPKVVDGVTSDCRSASDRSGDAPCPSSPASEPPNSG